MNCSLDTYWYHSEDDNDRKVNSLVTLDQFLITISLILIVAIIVLVSLTWYIDP
jgi:hypothetical protein